MALTTESAARKDSRTAAASPRMEHRHFAVIADVLRDTKPGAGQYDGADAAREQWQDTVAHFVTMLCGTNPKFDKRRFLQACNCE